MWVTEKYCGQSSPPNMNVPGRNLKINFQSDDNVGKRGFQIGINIAQKQDDNQLDCNFDLGLCRGKC
jgi:hypothetical protein